MGRGAKFWDLKSFECIARLNNNNLFVHSFTFLGSKIISGSEDTTIKIWSLEEFVKLTTLNDHKDSVNNIKFINNGTKFASASADDTIRFWDVFTGEFISKTKQNKSVLSLAVMSNGDLVSTSEDKTIKIWDTDLFYNISSVF